MITTKKMEKNCIIQLYFISLHSKNKNMFNTKRTNNMRKTLLMIMMVVLCTGTVNAQSVNQEEAANKVYDVVELMPSFPGGQTGLMQYLADNIKYPQDAEEQKKGGRVLVQFIIGKEGNIYDVEIVKSVFPSLDEEAMRVIREMPRWIPGKQEGKAVNVKYIMPITFRLE